VERQGRRKNISYSMATNKSSQTLRIIFVLLVGSLTWSECSIHNGPRCIQGDSRPARQSSNTVLYLSQNLPRDTTPHPLPRHVIDGPCHARELPLTMRRSGGDDLKCHLEDHVKTMDLKLHIHFPRYKRRRKLTLIPKSNSITPH
jgi:hypothetical protein